MITFPQAIVRDAIERVVTIRHSAVFNGVLRLWVGPLYGHRSSWFDVSEVGEITATTRGGGKRSMLDGVGVEDLPMEAARLVAWVRDTLPA